MVASMMVELATGESKWVQLFKVNEDDGDGESGGGFNFFMYEDKGAGDIVSREKVNQGCGGRDCDTVDDSGISREGKINGLNLFRLRVSKKKER